MCFQMQSFFAEFGLKCQSLLGFVVEHENLWGFVLFVLVQPLMAENPDTQMKCLFYPTQCYTKLCCTSLLHYALQKLI